MKTNNKKSDTKKKYKKYSYGLKRRIVYEIRRGILSREEAKRKYGIRSGESINYWLKKYSLLNYNPEKDYGMNQSPEEKIKELQARIEELESEKLILNTAIDIADEEFNTQIRKKYLPQPLKDYKKHKGGKS